MFSAFLQQLETPPSSTAEPVTLDQEQSEQTGIPKIIDAYSLNTEVPNRRLVMDQPGEIISPDVLQTATSELNLEDIPFVEATNEMETEHIAADGGQLTDNIAAQFDSVQEAVPEEMQDELPDNFVLATQQPNGELVLADHQETDTLALASQMINDDQENNDMESATLQESSEPHGLQKSNRFVTYSQQETEATLETEAPAVDTSLSTQSEVNNSTSSDQQVSDTTPADGSTKEASGEVSEKSPQKLLTIAVVPKATISAVQKEVNKKELDSTKERVVSTSRLINVISVDRKV